MADQTMYEYLVVISKCVYYIISPTTRKKDSLPSIYSDTYTSPIIIG